MHCMSVLVVSCLRSMPDNKLLLHAYATLQMGGNGWFLASRLKEVLISGNNSSSSSSMASAAAGVLPAATTDAAGAAAAAPTPAVAATSTTAAEAAGTATTAPQQTATASRPATPQGPFPGGRERCLTPGAFAVFVDMFDVMLGAAAGQEDFRVVHAALQLGMYITCKPGERRSGCNNGSMAWVAAGCAMHYCT